MGNTPPAPQPAQRARAASPARPASPSGGDLAALLHGFDGDMKAVCDIMLADGAAAAAAGALSLEDVLASPLATAADGPCAIADALVAAPAQQPAPGTAGVERMSWKKARGPGRLAGALRALWLWRV